MAYTPINWQTGDTITVEKMNKMDNGWGVSSTQLFSETVTTAQSQYGYAAPLAYTTTEIPPATLTITLNGTDYDCTQQVSGSYFYYGASPGDFSIYPFTVMFNSGHAILITQTAGTYTVSARGEVVEISTTFSDAVKKSVDADSIPLKCIDGETTINAMQTSRQDGRMMYFSDGQAFYFINDFISASDNPTAVTFYPTTTDFTAGFDANGIFTIYWS